MLTQLFSGFFFTLSPLVYGFIFMLYACIYAFTADSFVRRPQNSARHYLYVHTMSHNITPAGKLKQDFIKLIFFDP